jgi:hypothetical protein
MTPFPAGHQFAQNAFPGRSAARSGALLTRDRKKRRACNDPGSAVHRWRAAPHPGNGNLLDLILAKFDVFLGDRVVFLLHQFVGHGARILPRHVIKTGIRAGYEFDFYRGALGHKTLKIAALRAS